MQARVGSSEQARVLNSPRLAPLLGQSVEHVVACAADDDTKMTDRGKTISVLHAFVSEQRLTGSPGQILRRTRIGDLRGRGTSPARRAGSHEKCCAAHLCAAGATGSQ